MIRPENSLPELDFMNFWKPIVGTFQFFCISHYGIFRHELKSQPLKLNSHRLFFILNVSIQLMSSGYNVLQLQTQSPTMEKYNVSPIFTYVNFGTKFTLSLSIMMISLETYFKRNKEQQLFETLQCIDKIFKKKLKHDIDYRAQRRRQMRNICIYFTVITTIIISSLSINISIARVNVRTFLGILFFAYVFVLSRMRVFQIALLVNAVGDLLAELEISMRRQQQRTKYNPARWKDVQYCRKIYSKIWHLSTLISDCFGYSMVLFVANSTVQIIGAAYWNYLNIDSINSSIVHLSEYSITHEMFPTTPTMNKSEISCRNCFLLHADTVDVILFLLDLE